MIKNSYTITMKQLDEQIMKSFAEKVTEGNVLVLPGSNNNVQQQPSQQEPMQMPTEPASKNGEIEASINKPKFDAGVDADPETDPKKYIQQLTGKLSTELQKFNNDNANEAEELNKYVLGMLVKQAGKNMSEQDKKEIIKKLNSSGEPDVQSEEEPQGNGNEEIPTNGGNEEVQQEDLLHETLSDTMEEPKDGKQRINTIGSKATKANKPYKPKY